MKAKKPLNPEQVLISLGITSMGDLEKAKSQFSTDKEMSEALRHISSGDVEMLEKVLKMIERAKRNVKAAMMLNNDYDCSGWKEGSLTTIEGIKKHGRSLKLVIRPGDGEQIILFYPEEYQTLEEVNNELWYDKETEQGIYSFGRFLKKAKVNRMPL